MSNIAVLSLLGFGLGGIDIGRGIGQVVTFLPLAKNPRAWSCASSATLYGPTEVQWRAIFGQLPVFPCYSFWQSVHRVDVRCQQWNPYGPYAVQLGPDVWFLFFLGRRYWVLNSCGCPNANSFPPTVLSLLSFSLSVSLITLPSLSPPLALHSLPHRYL